MHRATQVPLEEKRYRGASFRETLVPPPRMRVREATLPPDSWISVAALTAAVALWESWVFCRPHWETSSPFHIRHHSPKINGLSIFSLISVADINVSAICLFSGVKKGKKSTLSQSSMALTFCLTLSFKLHLCLLPD